MCPGVTTGSPTGELIPMNESKTPLLDQLPKERKSLLLMDKIEDKHLWITIPVFWLVDNQFPECLLYHFKTFKLLTEQELLEVVHIEPGAIKADAHYLRVQGLNIPNFYDGTDESLETILRGMNPVYQEPIECDSLDMIGLTHGICPDHLK